MVTGILIKWIKVNAKPIAIGAKPAGARLSVEPRITIKKIAVKTISIISAESKEYFPGDKSPKPFVANPPVPVNPA